MPLPIYPYGDPALRKEVAPVQPETPGLQPFIDRLLYTLEQSGGQGLAAPQVGRPWAVFAVNLTPIWRSLSEAERSEIPPQPMVCINPVLTVQGGGRAEVEGECLSVPSVRERLWRPSHVVVDYRDRDFRSRRIEAKGAIAALLHQQVDTLNGVLFVDHLTPLRRLLIGGQLRKVARCAVATPYPMALSVTDGPSDNR